MENEFFYFNVNKDLDVETWISRDQVALNLASRNDDTHCAFLNAEQARKLAAALLKFADQTEGK